MEQQEHACSYCDRTFTSRFAACGHLATGCEQFRASRDKDRARYLDHQREILDSRIPLDDWAEEEALDLEDALLQLPTIFDRYLEHQKSVLSIDAISELQSGYVNLTDGITRRKADIRIYLDLCKFVANCRSISGEEATELIHLIKRITRIAGVEIPWPQSYNELQKTVINVLAKHKVPVMQCEFDLPSEIFGSNPHESGKHLFMQETYIFMLVT